MIPLLRCVILHRTRVRIPACLLALFYLGEKVESSCGTHVLIVADGVQDSVRGSLPKTTKLRAREVCRGRWGGWCVVVNTAAVVVKWEESSAAGASAVGAAAYGMGTRQ